MPAWHGGSGLTPRIAVLVALVAAATSVGLAQRGRQIPFAGTLAGRVDDAGAVSERLASPPRDGSQPLVFLVAGSDSREALPASLRARFGDLSSQRTDTLMLVELVTATRKVQVLSLPRALRVDVPGVGPQKLNAVEEYAGAVGLIDAVGRLTGLPIHHFVQIDFLEFAAIVDTLGGVTLDFPFRARDQVTGFHAAAGRSSLDGTQALAYVRSRAYQELRSGRWVYRDASDLGRIGRQQRLLAAVARRARQAVVSGHAAALWTLSHHLRVDGKLSLWTALRLSRQLSAVDPGTATMRVLPSRPLLDPSLQLSPFPPQHPGTIAYLERDEPAAAAMLAAFQAGRPLPPWSGP